MSDTTEADVRAEVSAWLKANWSPDYGLVEWRLKLIESGWGAPHYPKEWHGRGLPVKFNDDRRRRVQARSARSPSAAPASARWRPRPSSITAATCTKKSS